MVWFTDMHEQELPCKHLRKRKRVGGGVGGKRQQDKKKGWQISFGMGHNVLGFLLSMMCCRGLWSHMDAEDVSSPIQKEFLFLNLRLI